MPEDEIAAHLRMGRSKLRARHILDVKAGREIRRHRQMAAADEELTRKEAQLYRACMAGFDNPKWLTPDGRCRLHHNKTREEAEADFAERLARLRGS
jgi:hypothetical protein